MACSEDKDDENGTIQLFTATLRNGTGAYKSKSVITNSFTFAVYLNGIVENWKQLIRVILWN